MVEMIKHFDIFRKTGSLWITLSTAKTLYIRYFTIDIGHL